MIISHKHRYIFVELPHTGTTAISRELQANYDGQSILFRHATYDEFLRHATDEEKKYFVFSTIRNPLDDAVTCYFKYKNQVKGFIGFDVNSKPKLSDRRDLARRFVYGFRFRRYKFIHDNDASFADFFLKYYQLPYDNWSALSHQKFDYIIRFENLADDFMTALKLLNIEPVRPLPTVNKTSGRSRDYSTYYTPETQKRAARIFGPYMKKWGYDFPADWGDLSFSQFDQFSYATLSRFRRFGWRYLRPAVYAFTVEKRKPAEFRTEQLNLSDT